MQNNGARESTPDASEQTQQAGPATYQDATAIVKDTLITLKVKSALLNAGLTTASEIHVSTNAGVVTLKGKVQDAGTSTHVETLARATGGVRDVTNHLQVASAN
jgi:osmotically-inducible protein OsmY